MKNYYETLELDKKASPEDIKKAYRRKAMEYHPDQNQGDKECEAKFKEVTEAYRILSDDNEKAFYDRHGTTRDDSNHRQSQRGNRASHFSGFSGADMNYMRKTATLDIKIPCPISIANAIQGGKMKIQFNRKIDCGDCGGKGYKKTDKTCGDCGGAGRISVQSQNLIFETTCGSCAGSGSILEKCPKCEGRSHKVDKFNGNVSVPAGIRRKSWLKVAGKGNEILHEGRKIRGDALLLIDYPNSEENVGLDNHGNLHIDLPVPINSIMENEEIELNILKCKKIKVKLDDSADFNHIYTIKGGGATEKDLAFVKVFPVLPKNDISKENKEKITKVMREVYGQPEKTFSV